MFFSSAYAQVNTQQEAGSDSIVSFFGNIAAQIPYWILAIIVFVLFWILAKVIKKIVVFRLTAKKDEIHEEVVLLTERIVYFSVLLLGLFLSSKIVGFNLEVIFGVLSLGIGFALKDLIANFIGGMMILSQDKFKTGDTIQIGDTLGTIEKMDVRTTEIKGFDGVIRIIPNADMLTSVISNYQYHPIRRIDFNIGVHYSTKLSSIDPVIREAMQSIPEIMSNPIPEILATEFGDSAITFSVRFWVSSSANWFDIRSQLIQKTKQMFDQRNITIPFPIRTLTLDEHDKNILHALRVPGGVNTQQSKQYTPNPENTVSPPQTQF